MKKTALALGAATAAGAAAAAAMKKKGICPFCEAKKLARKLAVGQKGGERYNNGAALTPPMGWSSWNLFGTKISEKLICEIADAMEKSGLSQAGYKYVNIDDCWQSSRRDDSGRLACDRATFPSGIKSLCEYVNSKGLKLGIYSSNGTHTCEDYPGSLGHERIDAQTFAEWGVEYFKYDFCHNKRLSSKSPKISMLEISEPGKTAFAFYKPSAFTLSGDAAVTEDKSEKSDSGLLLVGLDAGCGKASLSLNAEHEGKYILTFVTQKQKGEDRFLLVTVNSQAHHLHSVGSLAANGFRRLQLEVYLNRGENTLVIENPVGSKFDSAALLYKLMGSELKRATRLYAEQNGAEEKPIVFSICEWGFNFPYKWGAAAGNLWRTTGDIKPVWASVSAIYETNVRLSKYAAPGGWNDPDMLEVGNGNLTYNENKAHFSLWCMMCAPLILGNDVRRFIRPDGTVDKDNRIYQILTNERLIKINQDPLGVQCRRIKSGIVDILVKPLDGCAAAVCVFNKGSKDAQTKVDIKKLTNLSFLNLAKKSGYSVTDAWSGEELENVSCVTAKTASHDVCVYIIS